MEAIVGVAVAIATVVVVQKGSSFDAITRALIVPVGKASLHRRRLEMIVIGDAVTVSPRGHGKVVHQWRRSIVVRGIRVRGVIVVRRPEHGG